MGKGIPFVWEPVCSTAYVILSSTPRYWPYLLRPDNTSWTPMPVILLWVVSGVRSRMMWSVWSLIAVTPLDLHRRYCTTKREMLAAVAMCIQFRSYLCGAKFTLHTDHKSLVWLHQFNDTEGMMARWLHALQQFQLSIVHWPGRDHGSADGLSRVPSSPCRQCTWPDCPPAHEVMESIDQPFDSESTSSSEDTDLVQIHSVEDWVALLDDDLSQPTAITGDSFRISALQKEDPVCITLQSWISSGDFPPWIEVKGLSPELRLLWHHRNNLSVDDNGVIWRKRSSQSHLLQLLVPKPTREHHFYWSGMSDDVKEWLEQCTICIKRKSPAGRHHPLGNIPTGHRWDHIAMDILDVCDPTPDGYRYI